MIMLLNSCNSKWGQRDIANQRNEGVLLPKTKQLIRGCGRTSDDMTLNRIRITITPSQSGIILAGTTARRVQSTNPQHSVNLKRRLAQVEHLIPYTSLRETGESDMRNKLSMDEVARVKQRRTCHASAAGSCSVSEGGTVHATAKGGCLTGGGAHGCSR